MPHETVLKTTLQQSDKSLIQNAKSAAIVKKTKHFTTCGTILQHRKKMIDNTANY